MRVFHYLVAALLVLASFTAERFAFWLNLENEIAEQILITLVLCIAALFGLLIGVYLPRRIEQTSPERLLVLLVWVGVTVQLTFAAGSLVELPDRLSSVRAVNAMDMARVSEPEEGYLVLQGGIGPKTVDDLASKDLVRARVLELDSEGGIISSAMMIANLVETYQIRTFVQGECLSACVLIAVKGHEVIATPDALFGFHRGSSTSGRDSSHTRYLSQEATTFLHDELERSGIPRSILQTMLATNSDDMAYYTGRDLYNAGVIDRLW